MKAISNYTRTNKKRSKAHNHLAHLPSVLAFFPSSVILSFFYLLLYYPFFLFFAPLPSFLLFLLSCSGSYQTGKQQRKQFNTITAILDGNIVYGVDEKRARHLREFKNGRLRMRPNLMLPVSISLLHSLSFFVTIIHNRGDRYTVKNTASSLNLHFPCYVFIEKRRLHEKCKSSWTSGTRVIHCW